MLYFENDYAEDAREKILRRFSETNLEKLPGYGLNRHTISAVKKIRAACESPESQVFFLMGGTQTNLVHAFDYAA